MMFRPDRPYCGGGLASNEPDSRRLWQPAKAFAEISRTLKPGGAHVYTVPYYRGKRTVIRAVPDESGGIRNLLEPDYHGNPIDAGGSLVITEWGDELCDFIFLSSRMTTTIFNFHDPRVGLKGEFLDVMISRKASAAKLVSRMSETESVRFRRAGAGHILE